MSKKIDISQLANEISEQLTSYVAGMTEDVKDGVKSVSKDCLNEIKANSPVSATLPKKGRYKRGWTCSTMVDNGSHLKIVIHNKTDYQLAHLLEKGHLLRNGGFVPAQPHIAPAAEKAAEKLQKVVKVAIEK